MDFKKLAATQNDQAQTEPRRIFEQLPNKKPGYGYLRDVQAQVLQKWHAVRTRPDVLIKVNTGGGKTIDGLLILQSLLNEGLGPALYVAPNQYLVDQVVAEGGRLGINVVTDPEDTRYISSRAIGVVNAHKIFNGRSVFSDSRPTRPPIDIGSVVIDDAHAAVSTVRQNFSLRVPATSPAFGQVLSLFESELKQQSSDTYLDIKEGARSGAVLRVPFWNVRERGDRLREILRSEIGDTGCLYWSWPAMKDLLEISRVVFSVSELTITPPCPPTGFVSSFRDAKRRIFLSATLADDGVLTTDFGAGEEISKSVISPDSGGDIGERMILAPQEISPTVTAEEARAAIASFASDYNVVVIVPSFAAVEAWETAAEVVARDTAQINSLVERLKSGDHVGLVVLVNRYDGIDFPQDAARILVIDGLPSAFSGDERLDSLLTTRETGIDDRQVQRIEQGMGRAVRSNEDYCVVFLIGARLAQLTVDPRTLSRFSAATQAQLALSREVAQQMSGQSMQAIAQTASQALYRDPDWVVLAKRRLDGIDSIGSNFESHASKRRKAFEAASEKNYSLAVNSLRSELENPSLETKLRGWLREQVAVYLDHFDPVAAQHELVLAREENRHVLLPLAPMTMKTPESVGPQAERVVEQIAQTFADSSTEFLLYLERILEPLKFDPDRTEEFEESFMRLGHFLGLVSSRPESALGSGPDNLWGFADSSYWVVEAKTGAKSEKIGKRDMGQLAQAALWFKDRFYEPCHAVPVMVHRATRLFADATPPDQAKILDEAGVSALAERARSFGRACVSADRTSVAEIEQLLNGHKLTRQSLTELLRAPAR